MSPFAALCLGPGHLLPSLSWFEFLRVSSRKDLERRIRVTPEVEGALCMLMCKPVWGNKIGHENASNLVAIWIVFDGIANFSGPKGAMRILVGTVEPRIHRHLANLVSRTNAGTCLVGKDAPYEDLGDRKPLVREIMISKGFGQIAVV